MADGTGAYHKELAAYADMTEFERSVLYLEFAGVFALEAQDATIGAVSGNLTNCQNNVTVSQGKVKIIQGEYET